MSCRVTTDWTYKGMKTLIMENKFLRVSSLVDKGSDIIEMIYKPMDIDFMWHSPLQYRNPKLFVESIARSDGSFLSYYGGGWQDILPSAGNRSTNRGAEWGLHGEVSLVPWNCVVEKDTAEEVIAHLSVECYQYPLAVDKWFIMRKNDRFFTIKERLTNRSEQDLEFSWLQHPAFGEPFIAPGCIVEIPAETLVVMGPPELPHSRLPAGQKFKWPYATSKKKEELNLSVLPSREVRSHDLAFLLDLQDGWYAIVNPNSKIGFGLSWDKNVFPYVWYWQVFRGAWDHPWFGRTWNIALEPCTSWPNTGLADQIRRGTAAKIKGNSMLETQITAVAFTGISHVERVTPEGEVET